MTELSQTILADYQVRKNNSQKDRFIDLLRVHFPELRVEESKCPRTRNLVLGDVESAQILVGAHYDTCARMPIPNFITPLNPLLSILYSLVLVIPMIILVSVFNLLLGFITESFWLHYIGTLAVWFGLLALIMVGPANPHTVNDNTSGVITLCELYASLAEEDRKKVAIIFFDNEEKGLIGSGVFRKKYKKLLAGKLMVNLDCVSDGDHILMAVSKKARKVWQEKLENSFTPTEGKQILMKKLEGTYYPSDQAGFPKAVAIAALKHKKGIGYYMDKIHTKKDTVMDEENIRILCDGLCNLIRK